MTSTNPDLQALLDTLAASANDEEAAIADNYRFEERVGAQRQQDYETGLGSPADYDDWLGCHNGDHVANLIKAGGSQFVPETFLAVNSTLQLSAIAPGEDLIRLEDLRYPLSKSTAELTSVQLADLLARRDQPEAAATLRTFVDEWNKARDNWPMFGAFLGDVQEDAEPDDWPHRLRDRLGLEHYQGSATKRIPVALMRYPAKLVLDSAKGDERIAAAFALPTALDGELNRVYFPAPSGHPYGATLNLAEPWQPKLSAEILNLRIDYQPKHLWKIGEIVRPVAYRNLRAQRDQHLALLRRETGDTAYGQLMAGRS
ncbi:MAG: hypothetical protein WC091_02945 [Sulfuricellaceae bacterium]